MSTRIGTLQPKARTAQPMWAVAILALLVVAIVAAIVTAPEGTRPREETTTVGNTTANAPTEQSGGIAQSFVDTPVSSGVPATHVKQLGIEIAFPQAVAGTVANTPIDLSGRFLAERAKQLGTEIGGGTGTGGSSTGGELCEICWKYR